MTERRTGAPDDPGAEEEIDDDLADEPTSDAGLPAPAVVPVPPTRGRPDRAAETRRPSATTPSEQAVHIDDRISKLFVTAAVLVFVLIFLNAILLGHGGAFAPKPTPTPTPAATATPSPSPSSSASGSASAAASPTASVVASPSATP
jgi:hypothetical protein